METGVPSAEYRSCEKGGGQCPDVLSMGIGGIPRSVTAKRSVSFQLFIFLKTHTLTTRHSNLQVQLNKVSESSTDMMKSFTAHTDLHL